MSKEILNNDEESKMNVEEHIDELLTNLTMRFNIPKPNFRVSLNGVPKNFDLLWDEDPRLRSFPAPKFLQVHSYHDRQRGQNSCLLRLWINARGRLTDNMIIKQYLYYRLHYMSCFRFYKNGDWVCLEERKIPTQIRSVKKSIERIAKMNSLFEI